MPEQTYNTTVTFDAVQAEIQQEYQTGNYAAALELAERHAPRFREQAALFTYWQICFQARLGEIDRSIDRLRRALEEGLWFGEVLLRRSPSLQPLQGLETFEELIALNQQVRQGDETQRYPMIVLRTPDRCASRGPQCPLLIGLHSNAATVASSVPFWRPAANAGWLVAAPQSRQAVWKNSYIWDDLEMTREQVQQQYQNLLSTYAIDLGRTVLAGHSMGGEAAIWMALRGAIPVAGFIAFGPGGPMMDNPDLWLPLIAEAESHTANGAPPLRGYLVYGQEDRSIPQRSVRTLADALEAAGYLCRVEAIPGAGHDFDPQFEAALLRGLDFISPPGL